MEKYRNFIFGTIFGMLLSFGIVAFCSASGFVVELPGSAVQKVNKKARVIEQCIDEYYQGNVKDEDLADGAAKGMVNALGDKYSQYFTEQEYEELMNGINGSYVGIGVTLRQEDNRSVVVEDVSPGGPAAQADIRKGDRFVRVDGRDIADMKLGDIVSIIKKEANDGKTIVITVERSAAAGDSQTLDKEVKCSRVDVVSVKSKKYGTVGYISVSEFDKETDEQFGTAVENMKKDSVTGLVVDVRDNGGGSLDTVINMLDELLPEGELITEKSKKDGDRSYRSTDKTSFDRPIVVLINGNSASASEVFAGTLQARGAATLVGTKSFGKGVVQTVLSLSGSCGGGLKLTTAEYFLPGGISIHQKGLTPDVEVEYEGEKGSYDESRDNQLKRALEILNAQ